MKSECIVCGEDDECKDGMCYECDMWLKEQAGRLCREIDEHIFDEETMGPMHSS